MHLNHLGGSAQQIGGHARIGRQVIISNITVIHRLKRAGDQRRGSLSQTEGRCSA